MRKLLLAAAITATLASTAGAQQVPDPRVADLVRAGKIRFALFLPGYTKDVATGELRGVGTGSVTVPLAQALAERLGIKVELVGHSSPALVVECLKAGACDAAYMGIEPSRVGEVGFSLPFMQQDFTHLVPAGSSIHNFADADRSAVRIAVVRDHASTLALKRVLKNAETVSADTGDAALDLVRTGQADAWATPRFSATASSARLPGSRVLEDRYGANFIALAVPKDQAGRLAYFTEFVEEAKASGLVQRAIERASLRGYEVVSPGKTN